MKSIMPIYLGRIGPPRNASDVISVVVLPRKIGSNAPLKPSQPGRDQIMSTEELPPRESMEFDVVIVGAGPSGLAAALRVKQINADLNSVVVEKGSEVGAHILSGAVIDPVSLDKLIPDWRDESDYTLKYTVKDDQFFLLTEA